MCGIFAYLGFENSFDITLFGLKILLNRGYDSCGIATFNNEQQFNITKYASILDNDCIYKLENSRQSHVITTEHKTNNKRQKAEIKATQMSIGHTRWATHGGKTDTNSHPHTDTFNKICLVHNGIIENYLVLKDMLIKEGYKFNSETDTEVIANLISYLNVNKKLDICQSILKAQEMMEGTWGIVAIHIDTPNKLYCFKRGSSITIGINDTKKEVFISSESRAFSSFCKKYLFLKNDELIVLERNEATGIINKYDHTQNKSLKINLDIFEKIKFNKSIVSPEPYHHWTVKEIFEQPSSILASINSGGRLVDNTSVLGGFIDYHNTLVEIEDIILIGCGSSLFACELGKYYYKYFECFNHISHIDSSELITSDFCSKFKTSLICLSQSGETLDTIKAINKYKNKCQHVMAIVNVVGSNISEISDMGVYLNAGIEMGVASTKSFTSQCLVLLLTALWFSYHKNNNTSNKRTIDNIQNLPNNVNLILSQYEHISNIAKCIVDADVLFILSGGVSKPIGDEGSLKIKELSYINCQSYQVSALKHGPFSLITDKTVIIFVASKFDEDIYRKTLIAGQETKSRGSHNIFITDADQETIPDYFDCTIKIPMSCLLTFPILAVIPLQIIAYKLAILKGQNPDFPRNLAKSVTVE
jgi:glucosamine--fructose-6-phosphate aminotransferase (isomerizing)